MVEVIVMASVATVGVLATTLVANATLKTSDTNEQKVAATNLAREGIELVRAARDSDWQAYDRQQQAGKPAAQRQPWDCYVTSAEQSSATPPGCDGQFGFIPGSTTSPANSPVSYTAYPNTGNGVPYFTPQVGGNAGNTQDDLYLICRAGGSTVYVPSTAPASGSKCPTGQQFHRRVTVQRGKDLGGGQYNLLVKSYVTWPEMKGQPVLIEEYLADWRKFS